MRGPETVLEKKEPGRIISVLPFASPPHDIWYVNLSSTGENA